MAETWILFLCEKFELLHKMSIEPANNSRARALINNKMNGYAIIDNLICPCSLEIKRAKSQKAVALNTLWADHHAVDTIKAPYPDPKLRKRAAIDGPFHRSNEAAASPVERLARQQSGPCRGIGGAPTSFRFSGYYLITQSKI